MPITFRCSGCTQVLKVPDSMAGSKGKCPKCGSILAIPGKSLTAEPTITPTSVKKSKPESAANRGPTMRPRPAPAADESDRGEEEVSRSSEVRKKKKRKSSPMLLYGLLGGGCALLLVLCSGGSFLAWWMWPRGVDDDLKFMPDNCQMVASIRISELMQSDAYKELQREAPEIDRETTGMSKELGLGPSDIDQMVLGMDASSKSPIVVLHTKKTVTAAELRSRIKNASYTETKVGKYAMQESANDRNPSFCVVDSKRILLGDKEPLRAMLTRDKKPQMTANLQEAIKQVDFSKTIAVAMDTKSGLAKSRGVDLGRLGGRDMLSSFEKTNGIAFQARVSSDIQMKLTLLCQDAASASDIKKLIDGFLVQIRNNQGMPKEFSELLDVQLKADGNKVIGDKTFKVSPLVKITRQNKKKR